MCFGRCINNVNSRNLDNGEIECVEDCSMKFIKFNNRLMQNFVIAQQKIVSNRMAEMEKLEQINETPKSETQQSVSNNVPEITGQTNSFDSIAMDAGPTSEIAR